ncbi:N-carbamoyl-L-amino acid hydrolase [Streptomyces sp. S4.7]|uniref:Zn-dependent hydrolase n=1 Tax=Streptomyces sp. S4.7 TaxID=2705439 RepID=UPI0013975C1D|nr:Zn-dependent hydrolase [Streptomyces sp. S4.7]QHY99230.1 N-carbamoyl-L-amino acid hydrolase [Streptomyces sp. S4.7]
MRANANTNTMNFCDLRIAGERLLSRLDRLRAIGATPAGGVDRPAFGAADRAARDFTSRLMAEAGLLVETDTAGNLIGRLPGPSPRKDWLVLGSHLDTVPDGGALDGAYGVLAVVEVLQVLHERGIRPAVPIAAVAFANEEGAPGTPAMSGSAALAGVLNPAQIAAHQVPGSVLATGLAAVGGDAARVREAAWVAGTIAAYLELHIEQGPVLERERVPVGLVTAITGRTSVDITVAGMTNHAGTTPMLDRRDALAAAAQLILAVQRLAEPTGPVRVATVGHCVVEPNAWNVVPGSVTLRADIRDVSGAAMCKAVDSLRNTAGQVAAESGVTVDLAVSQVVDPVDCAPHLAGLISGACAELGLEHLALPSGAGHDAQLIGLAAPIGMIFVPSIGGISHAPAEATAPTDLVHGANVLLHTVLAYDRDHSR